MNKSTTKSLLVGVGASAGGLNAFRELCRAIPHESGLSFVLLQHLDPAHDSVLADLLSRDCPVPVQIVENETAIEPDRVYVLPPGRFLELEHGCLRLVDLPKSPGSRTVIDHFFRSLARENEERSVGVVLSGTGTDGTAGLRAIRAAGGLALVQDPASSEYPGMPNSAIDENVVDRVLALDKIPAILQRYAEQFVEPLDSTSSNRQLVPEPTLRAVKSILETEADFRVDQYKPRMVQRRIKRRQSLTDATSDEEYVRLLRSSSEERQELTRDFLINVTEFFRDPEAFEILRDDIVPELLQSVDEARDLRVWIPGCSSGEEAYSIAISILEAVGSAGSNVGIKIFATDADESAIRAARRGCYAADALSAIPTEYREKYFSQPADGSPIRIIPAVRDLISFAVHDIVNDPPFHRMDLICCRNLLIYFRKQVQENILGSLAYALQAHGYLFLGSAETVGSLAESFVARSRKWKIFRKSATDNKRPAPASRAGRSRLKLRTGTRIHGQSGSSRPSVADVTAKAMLQAFVPCGVVVQADGTIIYRHGDCARYLSTSGSGRSDNLVETVLPELRSSLRSALAKVDEGSASSSFSARLQSGGGAGAGAEVRVELTLIRVKEKAGPAMIGIVFNESPEQEARDTPAAAATSRRDSQAGPVQQLADARLELQRAYEEIEAYDDELKAAREEATTTNEELQSANEELEANAEELRSLNEELSTVNVQLKEKVELVQAANDDVENFIASTHIPTVFLNPSLCVERFTPTISDLLGLTAKDIGEPIHALESPLVQHDLTGVCKRVLESFQPISQEIDTGDGRFFQRRVTPYTTADRHVDGVVVVFQDISDLKRLTRRARMREKQQAVGANLGMLALAGVAPEELMQQAVDQVIDVMSVDSCEVLKFTSENNQFQCVALAGTNVTGANERKLAGRESTHASYTLLLNRPVIVRRADEESRFGFPRYLADEGVVSSVSCAINQSRENFGVISMYSRTFRQFSMDDANFLVSIANLFSIALRAQEAAAALHESGEQFRSLANSIPQMAWITDRTGSIEWYNDRWYEFTGTTFDEVRGWNWKSVHHPDHVDRVVERISASFAAGTEWEDTFPLRSKSGEYYWFLSRAMPLRDANGDVVRWFGTNTDITQQLEQETALRNSEAKLRIAVSTNDIGTFEFSLRNERTEWQGVLNRIWGVTEGENPTQAIFWDGVHPDDAEYVRASLDAAARPGGDGRYSSTYRVVNRQNGKQSWVEATGQTFFEDGVADRMVGMVIDVTERKELEVTLQEAVKELQSADLRKNEFLAVLGHELRNPLAALSNSVEMLGLMPTAIDDVLGIMRSSLGTMSRLLDDLLDLNRISQDKIRLDLTPLNLGDALGSSLDILSASVEQRKQVLRSNVEPHLPVLGDATRLEQIFTNLISNSSKYTPDEGLIEVDAKRVVEEIVVRISDDGIGVDAEDIHRIFDPFYQVPNSNKPASGLGIGLALSQKLADLHGATLTASSPGKAQGTTVELRIPALGAEVRLEDPAQSGAWPMLAPGIKIVLIEDNEDIIKTLPALLESLNCEVETAETAGKGIELALRGPADVVLIDIGLPDMSGHEVASLLREQGFSGKLVALSGYSHGDAREQSALRGFDHHIAKPATLKSIARILSE